VVTCKRQASTKLWEEMSRYIFPKEAILFVFCHVGQSMKVTSLTDLLTHIVINEEFIFV
jgi:hypothetical protein